VGLQLSSYACKNLFQGIIETLDLCFETLHLCVLLFLLVFVLATFCWTKSLLCNVAAFTRMLLYPESTFQLCSSRRFCEVFKEVHFGSLSAIRTMWYSVRTLISQQYPSGRRGNLSGRSSVKASSVWTTRTFRPNAHQCLEASNSSRLHPFGRNGKSSGRSSEFEKNPVFKCIHPDDVVIPFECHSVFDKH
jgi:hypothetical protein